ncbi:hypothetical protein FXV83_36020 [Bradyrhizobium hipponense]|uniref:Uncharacterized protein n=1 Tax=Bradyrhizobium hipponense TaxID=2605638 RepID=A0A5S4YD13_9BRAD|nr:hypothetical protein [Bradyrhizobium hipponense]TYO61862.1 hypothetical protein FXV83_36020 [Bradyrhizobium hipponense]
MLEIVIKYILGESRTIRNAPASAIVIAFGAFAIVWIAMDWRYAAIIANRDGIIASRDAAINLIATQRDAYKEKLGGVSPDQAKSRVDALESANANLAARLAAISKRVKPEYPLEDEQKETLIQLLSDVPKNSRFHVDIFWPQLNGNPRNAYAVAELFSTAQWDVAVRRADSISGHGLVFAFDAKAAVDGSKRSPEAVKLIELFGRAKIDSAIDNLSDVSEGSFRFIVGEPN